MSAEASLAAILAAGGGSSQPDPAMLDALSESAKDPSVRVRLEGIKKLFSEGKPLEAAAQLATLNERPCMAAIYYKSGDVKHVQGSSVVPGATAVVMLVGSVRESAEMDVSQRVQGMLPPGCDAREFARKVVRGKVDEVSFEAMFGSKGGSSVMQAAVKAEKVKGGVDATSDASILVMRGMALMIVAYPRAHPFDGDAASVWAQLLSDLARAVQDGLSLESAVAVVLDPVILELSLRWKDVARSAATARPLMAVVMESTKEKRASHLRQRLDMQRREAPAAGGGSGAGKVKEEGGKSGGKDGEAGAMKKVAKQAEEALRLAKAAAVKPQSPKGGGGLSEKQEWLQEEGNSEMCWYMHKYKKCRLGKKCIFADGTPGHSE